MTTWKDGYYNTGLVRISITKEHIFNPGKWVMNVREFGWECVDMKISEDCTEDEAQGAAIAKAKAHLQRMINSFEE